MSATQHIEWLNLVEKTGPFVSVAVLDEAFPQGLDKVETRQRQRIRSAYDEWRDAVDSDDPDLEAIHREWVRLVLQEFLDYDSTILKAQSALPGTIALSDPFTGVTVRPDFAALAGDTPRLLVISHAPRIVLGAPLAGDAWVASPIERMTQLCRALGVRLGLVTNGECWAIVSVPADGGSSVATWFARIWQQEPVTLQAFVSLLGVRRCFGRAEDTFDSLLKRSLGHQNEITDTLGEQVRRAVEVLVQALDQADAAHNRQLLIGVTPAQLYEAGLTVMMRLVILLCAEQRRLLLLGEEIYDQHYAVTTLRARLSKEQTDLTDEVLERRHDAWSRLLAVCRAVYGGVEHDTLRLASLGGSVFDPDRFPFLEGREANTTWRNTVANPLPIDNRTVLMLLTALQVLEQPGGAQMLSYETLDIEQIGHVYEGLLDRTVKRVPEVTLGLVGSSKSINPVATLRELEDQASMGRAELTLFLTERTGRSESALNRALDKPVDDTLIHRLAIACGSDQSLVPRLRRFAHLLRDDNWKRLLVYKANSFIVTLGTGRRETGTHYTPKSLTEPIVEHTLEPLIYIGAAEGRMQSDWRLRTPAELLGLKVCDMAMGSAAFLVQVCRYMGERLVESWEVQERAGKVVTVEGSVLDESGTFELLPIDRTERTLIARRLVASRCIYGVDVNPMAVELAKVSLWLVTMMKGRPFSFLDHALKCGDSLVGVRSVQQIDKFSLRVGDRQDTFATAGIQHLVEEAAAKRSALEDLPSNYSTQIESKNALNAEAETSTARVKALADALINLEMLGLDGETYEEERVAKAEEAETLMKCDADAGIDISSPQSKLGYAVRVNLNGRRPFHWPVEFPEVFGNGGFDAFVGNPPFLWGMRISTILGDNYLKHLQLFSAVALGTADLCSHFLKRSCLLLRPGGVLGLITVDTIAQGDTREVGLDSLVSNGVEIFRAQSGRIWPGNAGVKYCQVFLKKGTWEGARVFDDQKVDAISSQLLPEKEMTSPLALAANRDKSFVGHYLMGQGFVLSELEVQELIRAEPASAQIIFGYLRGEDINQRPNQQGSERAINFGKRDLEECAREFPMALERIRRLVKPQRDVDKRKAYRMRWWQYAEIRPSLSALLLRRDFVLVQPFTTKYLAPCLVNAKQVFASPLVVLDFSDFGHFAVLQSCFHEAWVRKYSSTMGDRIRYSSSDCFETFPFPALPAVVHQIGEEYYRLRRSILSSGTSGVTDVYNRFHDRGEESEEIARLRALQVEMDKAVATAYGWDDLDLRREFQSTKQGMRYALSDSVRRTSLDRLLALNYRCHAEEVASGLHERKTSRNRGERAPESSELKLSN